MSNIVRKGQLRMWNTVPDHLSVSSLVLTSFRVRNPYFVLLNLEGSGLWRFLYGPGNTNIVSQSFICLNSIVLVETQDD